MKRGIQSISQFGAGAFAIGFAVTNWGILPWQQPPPPSAGEIKHSPIMSPELDSSIPDLNPYIGEAPTAGGAMGETPEPECDCPETTPESDPEEEEAPVEAQVPGWVNFLLLGLGTVTLEKTVEEILEPIFNKLKGKN